jgi:peptidyl-tRNA hydrolase ICT1
MLQAISRALSFRVPLFRSFSVEIPKQKLILRFARSSGPGGQNVNKVSTKVDMRIDLDDATDWLEPNVIDRIKVLFHNNINNENELIVIS